MKNILLTLPLTLLAVGCLENEEEVTVLPDGSVRVTVRARGDLSDLAGGYPVPLEEPWGGGGGDTARWLAEVGASTGGPGLGAAVAGLDWPHEPDKEPQATLEAHAEFRSVDDWPRWTGPSAEPYRHSYLERSASLRVLERGARTVYVFERVFHARKRSSQELGAQVEEKLPEALRAKFEHEEFPTREEWPLVWTALRDVFQEEAEAFVRDAMLGLYTEADASLAPSELEAICRDTRRSVGAVMDAERRLATYEYLLAASEGRKPPGADPSKQIEELVRAAGREALTDGLVRAQVRERERNAVLFALEAALTAHDHSDDLRDEDFHVQVSMPGTIVGGNQDELDAEGRAHWRFEGDDLLGRDHVMRVVSVLE